MTTQKSLKIWPVALMTGMILASSCGQKQAELYPHTGVENLEMNISSVLDSRDDVEQGQSYFVILNGLRVRSSDTTSTNSNIVGVLNRHDEVRILNKGENLRDSFVEVEIVKSYSNFPAGSRKFVSFRYLSAEKLDYKEFTGDIFMIENIATEKVRVYKRVCADNSCPHQMILETNAVVGRDNEEDRSMVGSYRLTEWRKFYRDGAANYPSWYDPELPMPPKPGKSIRHWLKDKYMPYGGTMRGAFGWYTALVEPNANGQWTHGTVGWGEDKDKFINQTKRLISNIFTAPQSAGCTRTDNESIAYLRQILPVGTPIIRIYAKEALHDKTLAGYSQVKDKWEYVLTKRGVRTDGQKADRDEVMSSNVRSDEIIEEGVYEINRWPEVIEYTPGADLGRISRRVGQKGNAYAVEQSDMRGVFYIDTGLVENYAHPKVLKRGGFRDEVVPDFMNKSIVLGQ